MTTTRNTARGMSLIELGMVMVFVSLALAPVIKMVGGPQSSSGNGNSARTNSMAAKEAVLANTMVDRVLSGDFSAFNCSANGSPISFSPSQLPTGTSTKTYNRCKAQNMSQDLYYQWNVVSNSSSYLPQKNHYYMATLNVMDTNNNILLTMPTNFLYNTGAYTKSTSTGISFSLDISNSMADASDVCSDINSQKKKNKCKNNHPRAPQIWADTNKRFAFSSPYLYYRYKSDSGTSPFPNGTSGWDNFSSKPSNKYLLDKWDNAQLDLVNAMQIAGNNPKGIDPIKSTPFNEAFPFAPLNPIDPLWGVGLLGSGDCSTKTGLGSIAGQFTFLPTNLAGRHTRPGGNAYLMCHQTDHSGKCKNSDTNAQGSIAAATGHITSLCSEKANYNSWTDTVNNHLSRLEAARTAAMYMLLKLESKASVTKTLELGFVPWGSSLDSSHEVDPEAAQSIPNVPGLHFKKMRDRLLWINRADPTNPKSPNPVLIQYDFATATIAGLTESVNQLPASKYTHRVVILLTDGEPTTGDPTNFIKNNMAPKKGSEGITLYAVGMVEADENNLKDWAKAAGGDSKWFFAENVSELGPIFDQIAYDIQKQALLDMADRYNISL